MEAMDSPVTKIEQKVENKEVEIQPSESEAISESNDVAPLEDEKKESVASNVETPTETYTIPDDVEPSASPIFPLVKEDDAIFPDEVEGDSSTNDNIDVRSAEEDETAIDEEIDSTAAAMESEGDTNNDTAKGSVDEPVDLTSSNTEENSS